MHAVRTALEANRTCLQREAAKSTASARLSCVHTMPGGGCSRQRQPGRRFRPASAVRARPPEAGQQATPSEPGSGSESGRHNRRTDVAGALVGQVDVLLRHHAPRDARAQHVLQEAVQLQIGGWVGQHREARTLCAQHGSASTLPTTSAHFHSRGASGPASPQTNSPPSWPPPLRCPRSRAAGRPQEACRALHACPAPARPAWGLRGREGPHTQVTRLIHWWRVGIAECGGHEQRTCRRRQELLHAAAASPPAHPTAGQAAGRGAHRAGQHRAAQGATGQGRHSKAPQAATERGHARAAQGSQCSSTRRRRILTKPSFCCMSATGRGSLSVWKPW